MREPQVADLPVQPSLILAGRGEGGIDLSQIGGYALLACREAKAGTLAVFPELAGEPDQLQGSGFRNAPAFHEIPKLPGRQNPAHGAS
jgi:hypothetical protein